MKKKLIEVALPLDAINREAAREKNIRHGHPATLHLWWARRPLAAARAVLFAQMVDDPSSRPDLYPTVEDQDAERRRLFDLIERLVVWEQVADPQLLAAVRRCIVDSADGAVPPIADPFCGGGAIPLEAQRLGLIAIASDLNPIPILINKALVEIPARSESLDNVQGPDLGLRIGHATLAGALAAAVRERGEWVLAEAKARLGTMYPPVRVGSSRTVPPIAWLWARTVICPNPVCRGVAPLVRSFVLGRKKGKEAWVVPHPDAASKTVRFSIHNGSGSPPPGTVGRTGATCLVCGTPIPLAHVRAEGKAGRLGSQMMAIVAPGDRRRVYLAPSEEHARAAEVERPPDAPDTELPAEALGFRVQGYGMSRHADLFTGRQLRLAMLLTDLIRECHEQVLTESGDVRYAADLSTYLAFAVDRVIGASSTLCTWNSNPKNENLRDTFARPTLSMTWDYAESNPFGESSGNLAEAFEWVARAVERLPGGRAAQVRQADATSPGAIPDGCVVCTDPPYYDNVGYADLSDYFYIWLRRSLSQAYPELLATVLTPKSSELVADPGRNSGSRRMARDFFERGFRRAFEFMRQASDPRYPLTVFYAFKQAEADEDEAADVISVASTGWETMLEGLIQSGFSVTGTWPMRTERGGRMREVASNALASSIVLVCRPREPDAPVTDRRGFVTALKQDLPKALHDLQQAAIAPVDLAQAAIGPGMATFTRFARVIEPAGNPMAVRSALGLINQILDEVLTEQEGEFDVDTRWSIAWFSQYAFDSGPYGTAETLSRARNTSVERLADVGIVISRAGEVRLCAPDELSDGWDPRDGRSFAVWRCTLELIRCLQVDGESGAAVVARQIGGLGDASRDLAYRLFNVCERKGWTRSAIAFNSLVLSWPEIRKLAAQRDGMQQSLL